jgi:HEPN domain
MPALTRRRYPERQDCWHVYFGDVHVGTIARRVGQPHDQDPWQWLCGFYPGSDPGEQRGGTAVSFDQARADFEVEWRRFSVRRAPADAYLSAARKLDEHDGHFSPKYFLLSHALELALKAFIVANGGTEREIKKIRHYLEKALSRAIELGLRPTSSELADVVGKIAVPHEDYSFRYANSCWTHILPSTDALQACVASLIDDVTPAVERQRPAVLRIG